MYWRDLERIAEAHGLCSRPVKERCALRAMARYARTAEERRIDIVLTDGRRSVEGSLILTGAGLKVILKPEKQGTY